jgi:hypothetical protein
MALSLLAVVAVQSASGVLITKSPDWGPWWYPLTPQTQGGGAVVYANSFVAPISGSVTALGTWLSTMIDGVNTYDPATAVKFEVWGSYLGGPDYTGPGLCATTGPISGMQGVLTYHLFDQVNSIKPLVADQTYWFVASVVGASGSGRYQVGGHTQNSEGISDDGTFWYASNPGNLAAFNAQSLTPEMAFTVEITASVPDAAGTVTLTGLALFGLAGFGKACRRQLA